MAQKSNPPVTKTEAPPAFLQLLRVMEQEATAEADENLFESPMVAGIVKIFSTDDESEMWDADELVQTGGRDLADIEQTILEYAIKYSANPGIKSAFRDSQGRGMYLLVRSMNLETGETFVWNTSAPLLVGKIMWLATRDKLPAQVVIRATDLGAGQAVLKLKPIPRRVAEESPF